MAGLRRRVTPAADGGAQAERLWAGGTVLAAGRRGHQAGQDGGAGRAIQAAYAA